MSTILKIKIDKKRRAHGVLTDGRASARASERCRGTSGDFPEDLQVSLRTPPPPPLFMKPFVTLCFCRDVKVVLEASSLS